MIIDSVACKRFSTLVYLLTALVRVWSTSKSGEDYTRVQRSRVRLCMVCTIALCTRYEGRYTCKACSRVYNWYVGMHVCMGVYDLTLGCVFGIAHCDLRT
jgi:hypothetical protein